MLSKLKRFIKSLLRTLIGKRAESLNQYAYDRKMQFRKWRAKSKRELSLIKLGFKRNIALPFSHLLNRLFKRQKGLPSFLIGPTNSANQATAWASALTKRGARSQSLRISSDPANEWFRTDLAVPRDKWLEFPKRLELAQMIAQDTDIVLIESLRPLLRLENLRDGRHQVQEDIELLEHIGKEVGIVFHGSDIRDVDAHAARIPHSPFREDRSEVEELRKRSNENRQLLPYLRSEGIPTFVTTRDLLLEVPHATWLPVVIDFDRFVAVAKNSPLHTSEKLRVLYLPSRSWLKSAELIQPVLEKLDAEGVIEWIKSGAVAHAEVPGLIAQSDLVIDQFLGVIGVFPIEALAAGRLVMSYVPDSAGGDGHPPIINITPSNFESELRRVATERPLPSGGVEYARKWHDGRASVEILLKAFGWRTSSE